MSTGRVRTIVVHDIKSFKESLIRTLIRLDVNYVNLSNIKEGEDGVYLEEEFHFLDRIYRFYDIRDLKHMKISSVIIAGEFDDNIRTLNKDSFMFMREETDLVQSLSSFEPDDVNISEKPKNNSIPKMNKRLIKQNNVILNRKLRSNKK